MTSRAFFARTERGPFVKAGNSLAEGGSGPAQLCNDSRDILSLSSTSSELSSRAKEGSMTLFG